MPQIINKVSTVSGHVPTQADLTAGEIAVNIADKKLFVKKDDGTVVCVNNLTHLDGGVVVAPATNGDSSWDSVLLLVPFDSDATDVKSSIAPTVSGSAITITGSGKFGSYGVNTTGNTSSYSTGAFGGGDWTVECWLNRESFFNNNAKIIDLGAVELEASAGVDINFYHVTSDTNFGTTFNSFTQGQWFHIAIVYDSGTLRSYLDGVQLGSYTTSVTDPTSVVLGNTASFDDLRVTAAARYPGGTTFTPPTAAHPTSAGSTGAGDSESGAGDSEFASVGLLAPMDADFADVSDGGAALVATNSPTITSGGKFGSFGDFDAADQIVYSSVSYGVGDFTVEAWIKRSTDSFGIGITAQVIEVPGVVMLGRSGTTSLILHEDDFGSWETVGSSYTFSDQDWHHIAIVRDGSTIRLYADGVQVSTMFFSGANATTLQLGRSNATFGGVFGIDDLRVTASARYPGGTTFTPPATAHPTSGGDSSNLT